MSLFEGLLDCFSTSCEFSLDDFPTWHLTLHPRVANNVRHIKPFTRVERQHGRDQMLEPLRVVAWWLESFVDCPKCLGIVSGEKSVIRITYLCAVCSKRWVLGSHPEEDDTTWEQVSSFALVGKLLDDFWGHEAHCSSGLSQKAASILASQGGGKAEICYFQVTIVVK